LSRPCELHFIAVLVDHGDASVEGAKTEEGRADLDMPRKCVRTSIGLPLAQAQEAAPEPQKKTVVIDRRKLLIQPRNADGKIMETPFAEDPVLWMQTKQQSFYGRMASAIRKLKSSSALNAAWTLLTISFFYGVFHAAGPGHGKAVVTDWVLATENELKRGIVIAFLLAMFQALAAIVAVAAILLFVNGATCVAKNVASYLESVSYFMIAGMGTYLFWNGWKNPRSTPAILSAAAAGYFELLSRWDSVVAIGHVHDENCGHAHAPVASDLKGDWSWYSAVAMAFAVGIRPCSGVMLVLVVSYTLGQFWAGVLASLAMGLGVFITIATIASLTVYAKTMAQKLVSADNHWTMLFVKLNKMVFGVLIATMGLLLFSASFGSRTMGM
jgi:nickel/cobalt transporter (NicO) family protein